ncbi:integrase [Ralstonia phage RS138]|uniref:integrase n=1 Tax=Ralstonia phage RS138 TaxID=1483485 RepID=UPI0006BE13D2|nr:integrase [Ralstonia phage RS138]BAS32804.1 integrase [Ralstonia phage RS138]
MMVTVKDIAAALSVARQAIDDRARREDWVFELQAGRGGQRKVFALSNLPASIRKAVQRHKAINSRAEAARAVDVMLERVKAKAEAEAEDKRARGENNLKALMADMPAGVKSLLDARFGVVRAWENWFAASQPMRRTVSWEAFAAAYNAREIQVAAAVLATMPTVSARSVQRWVLEFERSGLAGLIDHRDGKQLKDVNVFTTQPELERATIALLIARPHLGVQNLLDLIAEAATDSETGEHLFVVPTYHQAYRFLRTWRPGRRIADGRHQPGPVEKPVHGRVRRRVGRRGLPEPALGNGRHAGRLDADRRRRRPAPLLGVGRGRCLLPPHAVRTGADTQDRDAQAGVAPGAAALGCAG